MITEILSDKMIPRSIS